MKKLLLFFCLIGVVACKNPQPKKLDKNTQIGDTLSVEFAKGFSIIDFGDYKILEVKSPWPEAQKSFTYVLTEKDAEIPENLEYDQKVNIPVKKMVVTSTTHIPSLESLDEEKSLVGFPNLNYVSSEKTRALINHGKVQELGENQSINTEVLIDLEPDVVIGFAIESNNKTFSNISKSGIPVVYNGDWTEPNPLGKAEWIKFFGAFYNKEKKADSIFSSIKSEYESAKEIAKNAEKEPTVLCGAMYKDVWYLPYGNSWQAQFIKDANADYLYSDTEGNGSISLAFESVLEKAQEADFWISPGAFTSYEAIKNASPHYQKFDAFQNKKVYSVASVTGETGGVLYYELAPNRPDLVLKDLIKIFHPALLPNYETTFFKPLQ